MPRYIDADALIRLIEIDALCNFGNFSKRDVIGSIKAIPIADVVPKSEVEEEVVRYIEKHLQYQRKKVDVPFTSRDMRNYQCGAIDVIEYFEELVAELKKKYTEGESNG